MQNDLSFSPHVGSHSIILSKSINHVTSRTGRYSLVLDNERSFRSSNGEGLRYG